MLSKSPKGTGKKRCSIGKSCGATCINRTKLCLMELSPEVVKALKSARSAIQKRYGKREDPKDRGVSVAIANEKITKLSKKLESLPEGSPRRKEIIEEIKQIEKKNASGRGYSDRQRAFRSEEGANAYMKNLFD